MKFKKTFMIVMSFFVCMSVLTGCIPNAEKKGSKNEDKTLRWVVLGPGKQEDSKMVWDEFNKKLGEKIPGVKIDFDVIPASDFGEKWKLISTSGEDVDMVWTGFLFNFAQEIRNGSYLPLDELLDKYGVQLKEELPEWIWKMVKFQNKIYAVPIYQQMATKAGMRVHTDMAKKYNLDEEKFAQLFQNNKYMTAECYNAMGDYLAKLKEGGDIQKGIGFLYALPQKGYEYILSGTYIKDNTLKVYNWYETDEFKNTIRVMRDWYTKGYIRQDILSVQDPRSEDGKKNGTVLWVHSVFKGTAESESKMKGFPIDIIPLNKDYLVGGGSSQTNVAIVKNSKNPELAMKVINLLNTKEGKDIYNMLVFGLEGKHYKKTSENRIETIDDQGNPSKNDVSKAKYGLLKWAVGNTFNAYETQYDIEGWNDYLEKEVHANAIISPANGFVANSEPISIEVSQVDAVIKEYENMLLSGAMPDYQERYEKFISKLKMAGIDKIVNELQKQVDEWKNNK